ncbi:MAG TPA: hypothetical protein VFD92_15890 [Candidatus Binatia bacterium]|nr:hypothetical protein [Candidatus Binatia bacterium]
MSEQRAHEHKPETIYFVNGERESTTEDDPTVRRILAGAGFSPATDYTLRSENPPEDYDSEYDRKVKIHPNQRFQAQHTGPTPTSSPAQRRS